MGEVGLYTALSGIDAETSAMDATSNNVSNADTAGYVREQAQFTALPTGGVLVAGIQQVTAQLQQANALAATSSSAAASAYQNLLSTAQSAFPEPGADGLSSQLSSFWSSWDDVANNPSQLASRTQVVNFATNLASGLNQASANLSQIQQSSASQVSSV